MAVGICLHLQWERIFKDMGIIHTNWRIKSEPSVVYDTNLKMVPTQWKHPQQECHSQA